MNYTYLLAVNVGGQAAIFDSVKSSKAPCLTANAHMDLRLADAIDTRIHSDQISTLGALSDATECPTVMGGSSCATCVSMYVHDRQIIESGGFLLQAQQTPVRDAVHSLKRADAFCRVATRETWRSIVEAIFAFLDETLLYLDHCYGRWAISTVGEQTASKARGRQSGKRPRPRPRDAGVCVALYHRRWMLSWPPILRAVRLPICAYVTKSLVKQIK